MSHEPALQADACYTLFFHLRDDGTRAFQRDLILPARLEGVPDEAALRLAWQATCAACSGEIYTDDSTWRLVVPAGASRATMELVFQPPRSAAGREDPPTGGHTAGLLGASSMSLFAIAGIGMLVIGGVMRRRRASRP